MEECYKCRAPESKTTLYEVIVPEGIMKICKECASRENVPMVMTGEGKRMHTPTVYERLRRMSGIDNTRKPVVKMPDKNEKEMKKLVEDNFNRNYKDNVYVKDALIDNFQWIVMRARRLRHISQEQMAIAIGEPEIVVKALEEGKIKDAKVIEKIERYLGVTLRKDSKSQVKEYGTPAPSSVKKEFTFKDTKNLTISQLQEMKKRQEAEEMARKIKKIDDEMDKEMKRK